MIGTFELNELAAKNADKISLYKWTVADKRGRYADISKTSLSVDEAYQREVKSTDLKIAKIASEWSWIACGIITVAHRDGAYFVVDGQHRVMAAMKRSDITTLPCMIFESDGVKDEANAFLRANRNRKPMTSQQAFKAMIESGDRNAIIANELAKSIGREVAAWSSPTTVSGIGSIIKSIAVDEMAIRRIFPVIGEICKGNTMFVDLILGMFLIERRIAPQSLSSPVMRKRLVSIGLDNLMDAIAKSRAYHGVGGDRVRAIGIINAYNHGLRSNRIDLDMG